MMKNFIAIYKDIRNSQKKPDGIFTTFLSRPVSPVFAYIALQLNLSPNFITLMSLVVCIVSSVFLYISKTNEYYIIAGVLWWISAILDSADGDLARFSGQATKFGLWLDSFIDRIKEFIIFSLITYIAFDHTGNELYLLLGMLSIFSTVMSGYISDTKKFFVKQRTLEMQFNKSFAFQMVDTRDFLVTVLIFANGIHYILWIYGTVFVLAVLAQTLLFNMRYGKQGTS